MKIELNQRPHGIALIIVMMVIMVLAVLAGGFAASMKVETRLARNSSYDSEFEWLGRSGVELARYILGQQLGITTEPYDCLSQKWAGGPRGTNEIFAAISLDNNPLGSGKFSIKIIDMERKYNINMADQQALQLALTVVGVDPAEFPPIVDSILDWRDADDDPHMSGTESEYYLSLTPPYRAKNGPVDDLSELLLIRGITPEMYWGSGSSNLPPAAVGPSTVRSRLGIQDTPTYSVGLVDLMTTVSGRININTASASVFQMVPGIDQTIANGIIQARAGPDGVDGNDDDTPFQSANDLVRVPGMSQSGVSNLQRIFDVRSYTFEVHVEVEIDGNKREMIALLRRGTTPKDVQILFTYWK